jgi:hypothetical protein
LQNKRVVYGILFRATADTLLTIAADPKHLGRKSVSLPFFTPGGKICCTIPTCIASLRAAESRRMPRAGSPVGRISFFPYVSCRVCSAACFCSISKRLSTAPSCNSMVHFENLKIGKNSVPTLLH